MSLISDRAREGVRVTLGACRLFEGMPSRDLEDLSALAVSVSLAKGAVLFREGEVSRGFYVVRSGIILVSRTDTHGREQVIHQLEAGDSFAEASMTSPQGYPAQASALTAASVLLIPKSGFLELLSRRPELALRIMAAMSRHVRGLVERLRAQGSRESGARLAAHLLKSAGATEAFTLATTRRVLAANLGMAEETLSRAFSRLRDEGLLAASGRNIRILDRAALERLAAE